MFKVTDASSLCPNGSERKRILSLDRQVLILAFQGAVISQSHLPVFVLQVRILALE